METTGLLFGIYTQRELLLAGLCVLAVTAWCPGSLKAEEKESELTEEIAKLRLDSIKAKGDFNAELVEARHVSWCEGVKACKEAMARKRDKAGRFA